MFTGLIEEVGAVQRIRRTSSGIILSVKAAKILKDIKEGDSVSVNGVCLTASGISGGAVSFDVVKETLKDTAFSLVKPGDRVNLERALRLDSRLGGHFVCGHADGTARIIKSSGRGLTIKAPDSLKDYMPQKASVALDGISLTIQSSRPPEADIAVIPYTMENTSLKTKKTGDFVNIEVDFMLKQVITLLKRYRGLQSS